MCRVHKMIWKFVTGTALSIIFYLDWQFYSRKRKSKISRKEVWMRFQEIMQTWRMLRSWNHQKNSISKWQCFQILKFTGFVYLFSPLPQEGEEGFQISIGYLIKIHPMSDINPSAQISIQIRWLRFNKEQISIQCLSEIPCSAAPH